MTLAVLGKGMSVDDPGEGVAFPIVGVGAVFVGHALGATRFGVIFPQLQFLGGGGHVGNGVGHHHIAGSLGHGQGGSVGKPVYLVQIHIALEGGIVGTELAVCIHAHQTGGHSSCHRRAEGVVQRRIGRCVIAVLQRQGAGKAHGHVIALNGLVGAEVAVKSTGSVLHDAVISHHGGDLSVVGVHRQVIIGPRCHVVMVFQTQCVGKHTGGLNTGVGIGGGFTDRRFFGGQCCGGQHGQHHHQRQQKCQCSFHKMHLLFPISSKT